MRGWHQQFVGFRVNREYVPMLVARHLRMVNNDPRKLPYLFIWRSKVDGEIKEAVRVSRFNPTGCSAEDLWFELKRTDGSRCVIRALETPLPRGGGSAFLLRCRYCGRARRALYGWEADRIDCTARAANWQCRTCAGLHYASEGGALLIRRRGWIGRLIGTGIAPRPQPWCALIFASPHAGCCAGQA